jgi:hypothetical protein
MTKGIVAPQNLFDYLRNMTAALTQPEKLELLFAQPLWKVSFNISERAIAYNGFGSIKGLYRKGIIGTRRLQNLSNRDYFKSIDLGLYCWHPRALDSYRFSLYFTLKEGATFNERRLRWQLKRTITWNQIDVSFAKFSEPPIRPDDKIQFIKGLYGPTSRISDLRVREGLHLVSQPGLGTREAVGCFREHY